MSWHINKMGHSIIKEMLRLLDDENLLEVITKDNTYIIEKDDKVIVGTESLLISHNKETSIVINTNYIIAVQLIRGVPS